MAHRNVQSAISSFLLGVFLLAGTGCGGGGTSDIGAGVAPLGSNGPGTALVSWTPPTTRTDGSALTDLAGYRVYYGRSLNALTHRIEIRNPGQTSQFVDGLGLGTWYFTVTAFTRAGLESPMSEIGSKRIL